MEIYKDIIGYENHYQVSDFGNVRSLKKGKIILKPQLGRHGYYHVNLSINGKIRTKKNPSVSSNRFPQPHAKRHEISSKS